MTRWKTFGALAAAVSLAAFGLVTSRVGAAEKTRSKHASPWMRPAAHLGVSLEDVGPDDVSRLKLEAERGVIVADVKPDAPAAKAGMKEGDVIVRFQGDTVQSAAQLARLVGETPPGRTVSIEVLRDGASKTLTATLEERRLARGLELPEAPEAPEPPDVPEVNWQEMAGKARAMIQGHGLVERGRPRLGITFQEVSGQLARYFKVPGEQGLLISSVEEGSPAEVAGLRAGDVIVKVGGREAHDADDLRQELARVEPGGELAVSVERDGRTLELSVKPRGEAGRGPTT
jgi:serine protease Do